MKTSTKILGGLAVLTTISFLFKSSRESSGDMSNQIEGLNINIDTNKLVDSAINKIRTNPQTKQVASRVAKKVLGGLIDGKLGL